MKNFLIALVLVQTAGCSGLNVSWTAVATYNTPHATPGAPVPAPVKEKKDE